MSYKIPIAGGAFVLVDREDYQEHGQYRWHLNHGYAYRNKHVRFGKYKQKSVAIIMHREIVKAPKGLAVDHINGDRLDNRKANLRICTQAQNNQNLIKKRNRFNSLHYSQYKGVRWEKALHTWRTTIKNIHIGLFPNELHAAMAYDIWAKDLYGEFAQLNFPTL